LDILRKEGVLHVEHVKPPVSKSVENLFSVVSSLDKAIEILGKHSAEQSGQKEGKDCVKIAQNVVELDGSIKEISQRQKDVQEKITKQKVWGDFSLKDIEYLKDNGIYLKFYTCKKRT